MNMQRRAKGAGGHFVAGRPTAMNEAAAAAALYTTPPLFYKPRALGECANRKAIGGWGATPARSTSPASRSPNDCAE